MPQPPWRLPLQRAFVPVVSAPPPRPERAAQPAQHLIKAVTYNILADKYALGGYHSYCLDEFLAWPFRAKLIMAELDQYDADVLCLQEVEQRVYDDLLLPWAVAHGFQGVYRARERGLVKGEPEGVALLFRTSLLELVKSCVVKFSDVMPDCCKEALELDSALGVDTATPACMFREQDEGATLALLKHVPTGRQIVAVATHLFFHPVFPDTKALQAAALCDSISTFIKAETSTPLGEMPVLIGGDFNSLWRKYRSDDFDMVPSGAPYVVSGVYELLSQGRLRPDQQDHPFSRRRRFDRGHDLWRSTVMDSAGLQLHSMHMEALGREPPLTTKTGTFAGCLDYLWVSKEHWRVAEVLQMPFGDDHASWPLEAADVDFPPVPDRHFPSDHLAVGAILELLPQP